MATDRVQRDLRIDFFKGVALLMVLVDHIEGWAEHTVLESWTLINLGFSDAAEIFIFLSGYVFAVAYSRTLDREGFGRCLRKAVKRSAQIYLAYLLAAFAVIAIGRLTLPWGPPPYGHEFPIGERTWESIGASFFIGFQPWGFGILAMYVLILPLMAVLLALLRAGGWRTLLACVLSAGLYLAVQWEPSLNLVRFGDGERWYFNPFAWQLLFFVGLLIGNPSRSHRRLAPEWLLITLSIGMLFWGLMAFKGFHWLERLGIHHWEDLAPILVEFSLSWEAKTELGPLRLFHFFALAYVTSLVFSRDLSMWARPWVHPFITAGQQSLEVYAFGLVVSFLGAFALLRFPAISRAGVIVVDLAGCVLSLGFAYLVEWWKGWRPPISLSNRRDFASTLP